MTSLPEEFLTRPLAHRGLHGPDCPENSCEAFLAAIEGGYGIELDVQLSRDHQAMVFHDYDLARLTGEKGPVAQRSAADLGQVILNGGGSGIPDLAQVLALVDGRVPLLIEIKDQDGALGPEIGPLEQAVAAALEGYHGPVAVMSFNPHAVEKFSQIAQHIPIGLVTCAFDQSEWTMVPSARCETLRSIPDFERLGACFASHDVRDLDSPHIARLKSAGTPILCWTVRDAQTEKAARNVADNITFESYLPITR